MILPWEMEAGIREGRLNDRDLIARASQPYARAASDVSTAMRRSSLAANPTTGAAGSREAMIAAAPELSRLGAAGADATLDARRNANANEAAREAARASNASEFFGSMLNMGTSVGSTLLGGLGGAGGAGGGVMGTATGGPSSTRAYDMGMGLSNPSGAEAAGGLGNSPLRIRGTRRAMNRASPLVSPNGPPLAVGGAPLDRFDPSNPTPRLTPSLEPTYIEPAVLGLGRDREPTWIPSPGMDERANGVRDRAMGLRAPLGTDYRASPSAPYDRNPGTDDMDMGEWARSGDDSEPLGALGGLMPGAGAAAGTAMGGPLGGMLGGAIGEAAPGILSGLLGLPSGAGPMSDEEMRRLGLIGGGY